MRHFDDEFADGVVAREYAQHRHRFVHPIGVAIIVAVVAVVSLQFSKEIGALDESNERHALASTLQL